MAVQREAPREHVVAELVRLLERGAEGATARLEQGPAVQLIAGALRGGVGAMLGLAISAPVLLQFAGLAPGRS